MQSDTQQRVDQVDVVEVKGMVSAQAHVSRDRFCGPPATKYLPVALPALDPRRSKVMVNELTLPLF